MHAFNWWCCLAATFAFLLAPARAQEPGEPPAPAEAMTAYRAVDNWVREWKVSPPAAAANNEPGANQPAPANLPACQAASITLRLAGEVIARGVEVATDDASRAKVIERAAAAALKEAEPKLSIPRDAMYETTRREVAKSITISMQLAGNLIPISPKDAADAMAMVNPGVEGVGARLGDRIEVMFPERMLVAGTEPGPALGTLVGKLSDDVTLAVEPLSKISKDHGAVFYKFRVSHLAQPSAGASPVFLKRCGRMVHLNAMDQAELRRWAAQLAEVLIDGKFMTTPLRGTYDPFRNQADPEQASSATNCLAAVALVEYMKLPGINSARVEQIQHRMLNMKPVLHEETSARVSLDLASLDFIVESRAEEWKGPRIRYSRAIEGRLRFFEKADALMQRIVSNPSDLPVSEGPAVLGLAAEASTRLMPGLAAPPQSAAFTTAVFAKVPPDQLISAMPWLGWAELLCHPQGDVPAAVALRNMRSQLWQSQLTYDVLSDTQIDLAGGIMFTASKQPMPTWQMARPLAFIATMLGDPRLTEEKEIPEELSRLLLSLRFLRQLTASEAECFMYKNPDRAIGGVRSSLWDQRMPPEATAMTLLTVCETLRSLDEISKRQAAPDSK